MTTFNHPRVSTRGASLISLLVVLGLLTACSGQTEDAAQPAPSSTASEATATPESVAEGATEDPFGTPDAAWQCGYVSSLDGVVVRAGFLHESGEIDEATYAARLTAVQDAWANFPPGEGAVTASLSAAIRSAADGVVDNQEFSDAVAAVTLACNEAGSVVAAKMLPGQGG